MRFLCLSSLFVATALAASAFPADAFATVGGPSTVTVLGYAPRDGKVYLVETQHGESGELPRLYFFRTCGPNAGRLFRVRSWYRKRGDDWDAFGRRLARLQSHLLPLKRASRRGWSLTAIAKRRWRWVDPTLPEHSRPAFRMAVGARNRKAGPGRVRSVTCYGRRPLRVAKVYRVAQTGVHIVVGRCIGHPLEVGYDKDTAFYVAPSPGTLGRNRH